MIKTYKFLLQHGDQTGKTITVTKRDYKFMVINPQDGLTIAPAGYWSVNISGTDCPIDAFSDDEIAVVLDDLATNAKEIIDD